jgi:hypothetical protein
MLQRDQRKHPGLVLLVFFGISANILNITNMENDRPIKRERKVSGEIPKLGRAVYERTDPDYSERVDNKNFEIYTSLNASAQVIFLKGLPLEERRALNKRMEWLAFINKTEIIKEQIATLVVQSIIEPYATTDEGKLIRALEIPWRIIVSHLSRDWNLAFQISPRTWEELIAAAFDMVLAPSVLLIL